MWLILAALVGMLPHSSLLADQLIPGSRDLPFARDSESNQLLVRLVNESPLQGLQFDVVYDPALARLVRIDPIGRLDSSVGLRHSELAPGQLRVLAYERSGQRSLIGAGDDPVVAITFAVSDTTPDDSLRVSIENGLGAGPAHAPIRFAPHAASIALSGAPTRFALYQTAPNPFAASTRVRFDVPRAARVRVVIHDLAGRLVRILVDEDLKPGRHGIVWDGSDATAARLSPGIYFCVMEAERLRFVRKLVRLR